MSQESCEIAVIGGGVIGMSCAWRLAQAGAKVHLFERGQCGQEASWAAGGMIAAQCEAAVHPPADNVPVESQEAFFDLCLQSRSLYSGFVNELRELTGVNPELLLGDPDSAIYQRPGIVYAGDGAGDPSVARFRAQRNRGLRVEEASENRELAICLGLVGDGSPKLTTDPGTTLWLPDEGQVENRLLSKALFKAAKATGVVVHQSEPVIRLETVGTDIDIGTSFGSYIVDKVLVCAGAWSGRIDGIPQGILPPVEPVMGQVIALRGLPWPRSVVYGRECYVIPRLDGRTLVGATMEKVGFQKSPTIAGAQRLLEAACRLIPKLHNSTIESHWAGLRPALPDGLPALGETAIENIYVASGHFRNGILLTPVTAKIMTDCILEGTAPPPAFSPQRFAGVRVRCASN